MTRDHCGYATVDRDGNEEPCGRQATGWRWYQDVEHEDCLDVACDWHANEGGRRIHEQGETFADELDDHVAESMADPDYRAAYLGQREADCGCCVVVDSVALREMVELLTARERS